MSEKIDVKELATRHPMIKEMQQHNEVFWVNPKRGTETGFVLPSMGDIEDAEKRLLRFAPYIMAAFPETKDAGGIIESPLKEIPQMRENLLRSLDIETKGRLFLKCDSHLAVSGSVKARGGIYEVLKFAEKVATEKGLLTPTDDYSILTENRFKELFSQYSIAVGSTGNLGLSIGIISAKLGFKVAVHMSADARQWKKDLLRSKGVTVVEYPDDYQKAVAEGRKEAAMDPYCHFVDDEGSLDLFVGYSVAAKRLQQQFKENNITVDEQHPVFVYLPCGVGGAPGGIAFGLKMVFGENIHCIFAEPTHAPCMLLGMMTGLHNGIAVSDIGIDGKTAADGLAVGRPSALVGHAMDGILDACYTIDDADLFPLLTQLADSEGIYAEPSAMAGFNGMKYVYGSDDYLDKYNLRNKLDNSVHIIWATGGGMVPQAEMQDYYNTGESGDVSPDSKM